MSQGPAARPGDAELAIAGRSAIVAVTGWFFADLSSAMQSPLALSLTFLLWLGTLLAAARTVLALAIGLWKRTRRR
ncbi:hypothetical protein C6I20_12865 [Aeromicrobium sp. A1-2]|uniref:hypothetical protein n=1 Tax=Aeromicrobium sp. A1-2 TaxID=2107713 RepID=UPI000E49F2D2|nr:hypothetical protein [Aeromicrobium sp. A1-2]AXT85986.1 hypothetical protein C6I20_12865 [Aeromicrobium sp. A1-2]